jgi:hypothetical protein
MHEWTKCTTSGRIGAVKTAGSGTVEPAGLPLAAMTLTRGRAAMFSVAS